MIATAAVTRADGAAQVTHETGYYSFAAFQLSVLFCAPSFSAS